MKLIGSSAANLSLKTLIAAGGARRRLVPSSRFLMPAAAMARIAARCRRASSTSRSKPTHGRAPKPGARPATLGLPSTLERRTMQDHLPTNILYSLLLLLGVNLMAACVLLAREAFSRPTRLRTAL